MWTGSRMRSGVGVGCRLGKVSARVGIGRRFRELAAGIGIVRRRGEMVAGRDRAVEAWVRIVVGRRIHVRGSHVESAAPKSPASEIAVAEATAPVEGEAARLHRACRCRGEGEEARRHAKALGERLGA
ncbi:hypothetical protein XFLAVUS301_30680 [Xanthobacter flavus]|uniref:Uncharacterized protein n=1 Tax=Xanthobacter flavus TaxID=281 RepID=A0A9W6CQ96_XANFL|nr:hypothetical protein XFLAVUS301_30680 [Xanthobacter flavus]